MTAQTTAAPPNPNPAPPPLWRRPIGTVRWNDRLSRLAVWTGRGWPIVTRATLDAVIAELKPGGEYIGSRTPGGVRVAIENISADETWRRCAAWERKLPQLFATPHTNVDFEALAWDFWVEEGRDVRAVDDLVIRVRAMATAYGHRPRDIRTGFSQYPP